jgi:hypothetical protein
VGCLGSRLEAAPANDAGSVFEAPGGS